MARIRIRIKDQDQGSWSRVMVKGQGSRSRIRIEYQKRIKDQGESSQRVILSVSLILLKAYLCFGIFVDSHLDVDCLVIKHKYVSSNTVSEVFKLSWKKKKMYPKSGFCADTTPTNTGKKGIKIKMLCQEWYVSNVERIAVRRGWFRSKEDLVPRMIL